MCSWASGYWVGCKRRDALETLLEQCLFLWREAGLFGLQDLSHSVDVGICGCVREVLCRSGVPVVYAWFLFFGIQSCLNDFQSFLYLYLAVLSIVKALQELLARSRAAAHTRVHFIVLS